MMARRHNSLITARVVQMESLNLQMMLVQQATREPPPSYLGATPVNPWTIIADYLPRSTLYSLLFTCKKTYRGAIQALWKDPGAHCPQEPGVAGEQACENLGYFFESLCFARISVRLIPRVLSINNWAQMYDFLDPYIGVGWLSIVYNELPNLKVLLLDNFGLEDSEAMREMVRLSCYSHHGNLRMFKCTRLSIECRLDLMLLILPSTAKLVYLDLSSPAMVPQNCSLHRRFHYGPFRHIGVLKLRSMGLTNAKLKTICDALRYSLWSLDIRDNNISDEGIWYLASNSYDVPAHRLPRDASILNKKIVGEDSEYTIKQQVLLDGLLGGRRETRLTHLYLAKNPISPLAINPLLESERLLLLDAGELYASKVQNDHASRSVTMFLPHHPYEYGHLISLLPREITRPLFYLRIHHGMITRDCWELDCTKLDCADATSLPRRKLGFRPWRIGFPLGIADPALHCDLPPFLYHDVSKSTLKHLLLCSLPMESSKGWINYAIFALVKRLGLTEQATGCPTRLRHLTLETVRARHRPVKLDPVAPSHAEIHQDRQKKKGPLRKVLANVAKECNWSGTVTFAGQPGEGTLW